MYVSCVFVIMAFIYLDVCKLIVVVVVVVVVVVIDDW
jgi:hypothetical protein